MERQELEKLLKEKEEALANVEIIYLQLRGQVALLRDMLSKKENKESKKK